MTAIKVLVLGFAGVLVATGSACAGLVQPKEQALETGTLVETFQKEADPVDAIRTRNLSSDEVASFSKAGSQLAVVIEQLKQELAD